jgi:hypothetical protein
VHHKSVLKITLFIWTTICRPGSWVAENKSDSLPNFKRRNGHIVFQIITRAHGHEIKHLPIQVPANGRLTLKQPLIWEIFQIGSGSTGVVIPAEVSQVQVAEIDMLQVYNHLLIHRQLFVQYFFQQNRFKKNLLNRLIHLRNSTRSLLVPRERY